MSFLRRFLPFPSLLSVTRSASVAATLTPINGPLSEKADTVEEVLKRKGSSFYSKGGLSLVCTQTDLVCHAVRKMVDSNVGALLVMKDASGVGAGNLAGIITERDYMRDLITGMRTAQEAQVQEIMTPATDMVMCSPRTPTIEAMTAMTNKRCRHLPVVDEGILVGMLSIQDCVGSVMETVTRIDEIQPFVGRGAANPSGIRNPDSLDTARQQYRTGAKQALGEERFQDVESLELKMEKAERRGKAARLLKELEAAYAMRKGEGEGEALTASLRAELLALLGRGGE